ncbi:Polyisoprenoid-binding protein YceI [Mucilaginibacter sp. OK268]|uniref:YceI family protein n=1 Tax=Mucilaginibacter sp. OK268 TaxID=1881048 RepID=UPI00088A64E8|nr:YceI family protein [Mucilaginibacter sp. OK268]SDP32948.1 Polyisoprenoid-binding protein YceI [Mucilaginibacter sp. OK268]
MKVLPLLMLLILTGTIALAQYKPVDTRSTVEFTIRNFGFDVKGSFKGIQGLINFDPQTPGNSSVDITIDANTINTDNTLRDKHLKDEGYFNVRDYPNIHFLSAKVTADGKGGHYLVTGKLTIKGKSKDISIPFSAEQHQEEFLFKGSFKINRKDFGIGGTSTIANELEVQLNIYAVKA